MDLSTNNAFEAFLLKKKIDAVRFRSLNPELYQRIVRDFERGGETSIEYGKKFLWNDLRMEFPLDRVQLPED
ncbi:MAG: hypothetical protein RLZZ519_1345 [Bacteroidota bacterium]|jgi:hypothetical protein